MLVNVRPGYVILV